MATSAVSAPKVKKHKLNSEESEEQESVISSSRQQETPKLYVRLVACKFCSTKYNEILTDIKMLANCLDNVAQEFYDCVISEEEEYRFVNVLNSSIFVSKEPLNTAHLSKPSLYKPKDTLEFKMDPYGNVCVVGPGGILTKYTEWRDRPQEDYKEFITRE